MGTAAKSPEYRNGKLLQDYRRRDYVFGACGTSAPVWFTKFRDLKCEDPYIPRNRADGDLECYLPAEDPCCEKGNPTLLMSGTKRQRETDYSSGSGPSFERWYNSAGRYRRPGSADDAQVNTDYWRHNYDRRLFPVNGNAYLTAIAQRSDGTLWHFDSTGKELLNRDGAAARLTASGQGWLLKLANSDVEEYDTAARLVSITTRAGARTDLTYDSNNRLANVTDNWGHQLQFTYSSVGLASVMLPDGSQISYGYDSRLRLTSVTYPDASARIYHYEQAGYPWLLTGITDESSERFSTYVYNQGRVVETKHAGGANRFLFGTNPWNPAARIVTYPNGATGGFNLWNVAGVYRAGSFPGACPDCNGLQSVEFDANGNRASSIDYRSTRTTYAHDLARNLETRRTEGLTSWWAATPSTRTTQTAWHPTFRTPASISIYSGATATGTPLQVTSFTHDANGNVLTKTVSDPAATESRTWTYTYNSVGQLLSADGPRSDVVDGTTYTYHDCVTGYQCGEVETVTNALGHTTAYNTYNAHGLPLTITDPNGVVTTLTYDLRQRLTSRTVGTEVSAFEYWPTGLLKKATLPDGSYIEYGYDAAHRLTDVTDAEGNRIHYTVDALGNRTGEQTYDPSNALARTSTRVFNMLGLVQQEIGAAGTANVTTTYAYDNNRNQTGIAAPLGRDTAQTYDELNRLRQVTDPLSGITHYGYNGLDQLLSVTDPRGLSTSYTYNALGDLKTQTSPDTGVTSNTYDSGGNLATSTDARSAVSTYTYDRLNRVKTASFATGSNADPTLTYTYDAGTHGKGHLTGVSDSNHSLSWTYDAQGRALTAGQAVGSVSKTTSYSYANGQRQSMTTPSGQVITYGYTNGKVTSVSVNGTLLVSNILYDPFGPVRQWTWSNGSLAVRTFDQDGKVTQIDSEVLKTYSYDDAFRITGITDTSNSALSWTYGYDDLDRLTAASNTGTTQGFTYDANGNRLTQTGNSSSTFTVAANSNRLSSTSGALARTYAYDNAGNTTSYTGLTFTYNSRGRMSSSTKNAVTTSYIYNALGQLIKKGANTLYYYDEAGHVLGTYSGTGALVEEIVWLGDIPIVSLRPRSTGGINIYNIHTDRLNTPRLVTGSVNPGIRWRWDAEPFGGGVVNNNPSAVGAFEFNLRFPGQIYVAETGLNYNYYRDYDPATGRYVESDPIGLKGGLNTYAYVKSNPLSLIDPFGLDSRAEPGYCFGVYCPPVRPPGGWSEEHWTKEWWEDFKDGASNIGKAIRDFCTTDEPDCKKARTECRDECMPELGRTNTSFNDCHAKCMERKGCSGYNPNWKT